MLTYQLQLIWQYISNDYARFRKLDMPSYFKIKRSSNDSLQVPKVLSYQLQPMWRYIINKHTPFTRSDFASYFENERSNNDRL